MLAPDGRCKTFDAAADGFVRAEGCGIVVLKRLSRCRSGRRQDRRSDSGQRLQPGWAQQRVDGAERPVAGGGDPPGAPPRASASLRTIGYVETHGTGTSLGDPIEVQALGNVLCKDRRASDSLIIGSVKTNIGHLEAAAGVAGLIKAALCVERGKIPPHLHFKAPNPHIPWEDYALAVPSRRD